MHIAKSFAAAVYVGSVQRHDCLIDAVHQRASMLADHDVGLSLKRRTGT